MHEIGLRSVNFQTRFLFVEKSHAQTGGQPSETFLLGEREKNGNGRWYFFVREKTDDRAATIATAHNCKQFEHLFVVTLFRSC